MGSKLFKDPRPLSIELSLCSRYTTRHALQVLVSLYMIDHVFHFQVLLRMVDVMEDVLANRMSEDFVYRDFCDGSYVRNHPVLKLINDKLLISFDFDELEVANPLGSKRGKHKLGNLIL